jgi:hypothetical protein
MSSSQTSSSPGPWDVPPWLKRIYEWSKVLAIPAIVGVAVAGYFGRQDAGVLGYVLGAFFCVVYFTIVFIRRNIQASHLAETLLSTSGDAPPDERARAVQELKRSSAFAKWVIVFLLVVALGSLVWLLYQPLSYAVRRERPKIVVFESIKYFDPTHDQDLFRESPFLEAVVAYLKDEGQAEGRQTGIVLGTTKAFVNPTPSLNLAISVDDDEQVVSGYAFRLHRANKRLSYDPVPVIYAKHSVAFSLPPCDPGDQLFFLGRLSLIKNGTAFPPNLQDNFTLSVSETH